MGIYVFDAHTLKDALARDAARLDSAHDFGRDILPRLLRSHRTFAFHFAEGPHGTSPYWRDVGTIDAYHQAHMELLLVNSPFDPYDDARWPTHTFGLKTHPASASRPAESHADDSFVCLGACVDGRVFHSVVSPDVTIERSSEIRDSILMSAVHVGKGARIRRAIIEDNVRIPDNARIGYDREWDRRFFRVTEAGVVVVPAGEGFPSHLQSERVLTLRTYPDDRRRAVTARRDAVNVNQKEGESHFQQ
jgi:glucose-1-phosphate adenylyltransferase